MSDTGNQDVDEKDNLCLKSILGKHQASQVVPILLTPLIRFPTRTSKTSGAFARPSLYKKARTLLALQALFLPRPFRTVRVP